MKNLYNKDCQTHVVRKTKEKQGLARLAFTAILTVGLVLASPIHSALAESSNVPAYEVGGDEIRYLDFPVYFVSDSTQSVSVSDIAAGIIPGKVISSRYVLPKLKADRWFIFDVLNSSDKSVTRIVRLDEAIFDLADLYYKQDGNWVHLQGGFNLPLNERALKNRAPSFAVTLAPKEMRRLYLKFYASNALLTLGTRLESPEQAALFEQKFLVVYMLFFGAVGALLAYNLFLLISLKDIIYFYYVMHGICYLIWTAFYNGFDFYFHDSVDINNGLLPVVPLVAAFHIMFMRSLLDTKNYIPQLHKVLLVMAWYFFAMSAGVVIEPTVYPYLAMSTPPLTIFLIGAGAYCVYRGVPMAPYYLIATLGNTTGTFLLASVCIGVVKYSFWARHGYLIGFTTEMIIFALALASRVKRLEKEKLHYQEEATRVETEARERLEIVVEQRTEELKKSNLKLEKLSQTDGLTGLQNRRHFDECLQREWNRLQRSNGVLSIILGDIDFFKKYNDHYGHVEGDACLQQVARKIMDSVGRESDIPARYGGEEFVVLMPGTDLDGANGVAHNILNNLKKENIPHQQSSFGHVTMSMGVAQFFPSQTQKPSEAIKKADALLYRAKEQGRSQVVAGV